MTEQKNLIPPKMLIVLELLPACGMDFVKAGVRAGYSESYARKLSSKFFFDARLQEALHVRIRRLLSEAGESDKDIVERVLQRQHLDAHPVRGSSLTGRSPMEILL